MTPARQIVIIEHRTHDITQTIGQALRNLNNWMDDGLPTRSPGDGNPGGGSINATSRPPRGALQERQDPARAADETIRLLAHDSAEIAFMKAVYLGYTTAPPAHSPIAQATYAHHVAHLALRHAEPDQLPLFDSWLATIDRLHPLCQRWAKPTRTPIAAAEQLATDLTETWCRRCLALGYRNPRHRGDRCRWCYDLEREHGITVATNAMIEAHEAGNNIRVARLINAEKTTPKRRKARR